MAEFTIILSKNAEKQLDKLSDNIAKPLFKAISSLGINPRPNGYKKTQWKRWL